MKVVRFRSPFRIIALSASPVWIVLIALSLILVSCGTAPAPQSNSSETTSELSSGETQIFVGRFLLENGSPVNGALVTFEQGGDQGVTDEEGIAEIETSTTISNTEVRIDSTYGTFRLSVNDIPANALVIDYEVQIINGNSEAIVSSIEVTSVSEPDPEPTSQEEQTQDPSEGENTDASQNNDTSQNNDSSAKNDNKKKPSTVNCSTGCHEPRVPKCGNGSWERLVAQHKSYCSSGSSDKKGKNGKKGKKNRQLDSQDRLFELLQTM